MPCPLVSVIILNYNGEKYVKDCVDSVMVTEYPELEVVFVDNASTDRSGRFIERNYSEIKYIQNHKNLGFAGGNNL